MGEHKNKQGFKGDYYKKEQRLAERRRGRWFKMAQTSDDWLKRHGLKRVQNAKVLKVS